MNIQNRIKELLEKKGWSLYKLSKETGIHKTTVYDWFNDKHFTPDRNSIEVICATLDISLSQFYCGIDFADLNEEQIHLLELFAKIPDDKKNIVFELMKTLSDK